MRGSGEGGKKWEVEFGLFVEGGVGWDVVKVERYKGEYIMLCTRVHITRFPKGQIAIVVFSY